MIYMILQQELVSIVFYTRACCKYMCKSKHNSSYSTKFKLTIQKGISALSTSKQYKS